MSSHFMSVAPFGSVLLGLTGWDLSEALSNSLCFGPTSGELTHKGDCLLLAHSPDNCAEGLITSYLKVEWSSLPGWCCVKRPKQTCFTFTFYPASSSDTSIYFCLFRFRQLKSFSSQPLVSSVHAVYSFKTRHSLEDLKAAVNPLIS